ncbi:hypothetical protein [Sulfurimonas sp.]|uniref:hypothetical protein n=1 Tax=Sulfurimonas sp. TaxID=2022749 RepID=UPI0025D3902D|nr:hypothetical protein [Sulfurimonas sp.]MDD5156996.1 hypothetical protein [Sulfurimonas sp.]
MKKTIRFIALVEFFILLTNIISFEFFINLQISFLSSFFIILGSSIAYKKMIITQVLAENIDEKRDILDEIEDPYELFNDEKQEESLVEKDFKDVIKDEREKIKILNIKDIKKGSKAGFSPFRLVPYLFLILGFIALKNNELLNIAVYLPSLLLGIVIGHIASKDFN